MKMWKVWGILFVLGASNAQAGVWEAKEQWTPEWENRYSEWVRANWNKNFFVKPGTPYTGLKLDCADAVYSMRVIFSAEHGLPFAFRDSSGGEKAITNDMTRFDSEPKQELRVRKFLQYVYGMTSTVTLPNDSYPISIDRDNLRAGSLILTDHKNHHSWTVQDLSEVGVPHLVYASRPAGSQIKDRTGYPTVGFVFPKGIKPETAAGFRRFRKPGDVVLSVWKVPGYSLDQYKIPAANWRAEVQKRVSVIQETGEQRVSRMLEAACQEGQERITAVKEGLDYLATKPAAACLDQAEYDDYSTPNRDQRLKDAFDDLIEAFTSAVQVGDKLTPATKQNAASVVSGTTGAYCQVTIAPGRTLALGEVRRRIKAGLLSNNPHDPIDYRWGYKPGHSARAVKCPKW